MDVIEFLKPTADVGTVGELSTGEMGEFGSLGPVRSFVLFFLNMLRVGMSLMECGDGEFTGEGEESDATVT